MLNYYILSFLLIIGCDIGENLSSSISAEREETEIFPGVYQMEDYSHLLKNKNVGLVVNHTSMINDIHLVDSLISYGVSVNAIFSPEHGFKGNADAGETVKDGKYQSTIPVFSLYGKNKKPNEDMLKGLDVIVFDIQDVGVRFYTYLSTLHYVMEAAAEQDIDLIILDRPNPNINRIDGPVLEKEYSSFVGLHPVPILYGMTIGEYGKMINGERWLKGQVQCNLKVVECKNYSRASIYELPIAPSPNLPNARSIYLYPSLCLFEGTTVSVGRGTEKQFQLYGHPNYSSGTFRFIPTEHPGAKYPKHQNLECSGHDLSNYELHSLRERTLLDLSYLIDAFSNLNSQKFEFFNNNNFFEKLAGTSMLRKQLMDYRSEGEIRASWSGGLEGFKMIRKKYLLYSDDKN